MLCLLWVLENARPRSVNCKLEPQPHVTLGRVGAGAASYKSLKQQFWAWPINPTNKNERRTRVQWGVLLRLLLCFHHAIPVFFRWFAFYTPPQPPPLDKPIGRTDNVECLSFKEVSEQSITRLSPQVVSLFFTLPQ